MSSIYYCFLINKNKDDYEAYLKAKMELHPFGNL